MSLVPVTIGDNPQIPGVAAELYNPDQLIAGTLQLVTQNIFLAAGQNLLRGAVLGATGSQANTSVAAKPATGAANTGNATIGAISRGSGGYLGALVATATDATHFNVTDSDGNLLGVATAGVAFANAKGNFTITAGVTPMVAGDGFTVNFFDAIGTYKLSATAAGDGSEVPTAILVDDCDASAGAKRCGAYFMGEFNERAISFGAGWTLETIRASLAARSIYIKSSVPASDPT